MHTPEALPLSPESLAGIRREFLSLPSEITPFSENKRFAALIACLGIQREVGTVNDELARFLFDAETGAVVPRERLRAELVTLRGTPGVRIFCEGVPRLELRAHFLDELTHPRFSYAADGSLSQLVLFPEIIAEITRREGVEPVLVKSWGSNSLFGGFDPTKGYYQTNFWELENNDALLFSHLVSHDQIAFLGTHDLIAHIAGVRSANWKRLRVQARRVNQAITAYFASTKTPSIASLILPYTVGVVLDDLAQPPSYDSPSHSKVLDTLLEALDRKAVDPTLSTLLTAFPPQFEKIIELSRTKGVENEPEKIRDTIQALIQDIQTHAYQTHSRRSQKLPSKGEPFPSIPV